MQLDAAQQEHYARHLLLDGFGGEGQERLLAAAVQVRGDGAAALWCARYLAASGVGRLAVEVAAWAGELRGLGPWLTVEVPGGQSAQHVQFVQIAPRPGGGPAESAMSGAHAAIGAVRTIARGNTE